MISIKNGGSVATILINSKKPDPAMERYKLKIDPVTGKTRGRGGAHFGNPSGTRGKHKPGSKRGQGGGRPPGSTNRMTMAMREEARAEGELPHEFALRVMRSYGKRLGPGGKEAAINDEHAHLVTWEDVKWAIALAAPYYAPRLAATRVTGPNDGPIQFASLDANMLNDATPEELQVLEQFFGRLAGGVNKASDVPDPTVGEEEYANTLQ